MEVKQEPPSVATPAKIENQNQPKPQRENMMNKNQNQNAGPNNQKRMKNFPQNNNNRGGRQGGGFMGRGPMKNEVFLRFFSFFLLACLIRHI